MILRAIIRCMTASLKANLQDAFPALSLFVLTPEATAFCTQGMLPRRLWHWELQCRQASTRGLWVMRVWWMCGKLLLAERLLCSACSKPAQTLVMLRTRPQRTMCSCVRIAWPWS